MKKIISYIILVAMCIVAMFINKYLNRYEAIGVTYVMLLGMLLLFKRENIEK